VEGGVNLFPKLCKCCNRSYTREEWLALNLVAENYDVAGDGIDILTLRNCVCNSTLSVPTALEVSKEGA
jgi:hypothetical protein